MSRATFDLICHELDSAVKKKNTMLRVAVPVRQPVAVCIWRLATGEALREVSKRFGLGISTCHKLVLEVCTAIRSVLMPKLLQWKSGVISTPMMIFRPISKINFDDIVLACTRSSSFRHLSIGYYSFVIWMRI